ncbi:MAG: hypothetical protein ACOY4I_06500 [Bacillota bacterium]
MEKIRKIFLLIGSIFFGLGMIWAGSIKMSQGQAVFGSLLIAGSVALIFICFMMVAQAEKKR